MTALPLAEDQPTIPLWPTVGQALGLGRASTYEAAKRGEIPGLMSFGRRLVVATATFRRALGIDPSGMGSAGPSESPAPPNRFDPSVATTRSRSDTTPTP